ncbi:MAG: EamA-like transporter family [Rhodobacteraceae bacterium HLUCCA08]|nr:MAG: EamA-like transporter family [Rhodobacteraceae bacterium HLUCCA08]
MPKNPFVLMGISILAYSLFPLVGALGVSGLHPFLFAGASHVVAFATFLAILALRRGGMAQARRALGLFRTDRRVRFSALADGILNLASHFLLFAAFAHTSESAATILFESWPLFGMLATVVLMRDLFGAVQRRSLMLGAVAFLGLALVVWSGRDPQAASGGGAMIGTALALAAALTMALSVAAIVRLRLALGEQADLDNVPFLPNLLSKGCASLAFLVAMALWPDRAAQAAFVTPPALWVLFNGVVIVSVGSLAYQEALALGRRTEVILMWYLTPLLAVVWLAAFGISPITETLILGALFIIAANLLLNTEADQSPAYLAVFFAVSVTGTLLHFLPPQALGDYLPGTGLVELVSLPVSIFGILTGFTLSRQFGRRQEREGLIAQLLPALDAEARRHLQALVGQERQSMADRSYAALFARAGGRDPGVDMALRTLRLKVTRAVSHGELLVLWSLAGLTMVALVAFRPAGFAGDLIAVLTVSSLVYLCVLQSARRDHELTDLIDRLADPTLPPARSRLLDRRVGGLTLAVLYLLLGLLSLERDGILDLLAG